MKGMDNVFPKRAYLLAEPVYTEKDWGLRRDSNKQDTSNQGDQKNDRHMHAESESMYFLRIIKGQPSKGIRSLAALNWRISGIYE